MRIRPFDISKDISVIKNWITDERTHAMWCANLIEYPIKKENFSYVMTRIAALFGDRPYVFTEDDGTPAGFYCYSLNTENKEGMLKFVMISPEKRGKGYGKKMIEDAVEYAFENTNAKAIQLNVFPENDAALRCYESVGFKARCITRNSFTFKDEKWGRCNMVISKKDYKLGRKIK